MNTTTTNNDAARDAGQTNDEIMDAIRAQVEVEMPTPRGGFESEADADAHREAHERRFDELCEMQTTNASAAETAQRKSAKTQAIFRIESNVPVAGRFERHTLREWKRIYGYEMGSPFVRFVQD
jgi:hypothetical protein